MSWYSRSWAPYVSAAQRQRNATREVTRLRKAGQTITPVQIAGRGIATTVWGKAWCHHLESYRDYENRLPRGRTYVRNGSVLDLQIKPRQVQALVSGSDIYRVTVTIAPVFDAAWRSICDDCTGQIDSLIELLQGKLSKAVMERLCRQSTGLFPKPSEIRFACTCPDHATMCKHVAASLYGVGARFDTMPNLLFRLRDVDETELITTSGAALQASTVKSKTERILKSDDVAALFGIDMAASDVIGTETVDTKPERPKSGRCRKVLSHADPETTPKPAVSKPRAKPSKTAAVQSASGKSTRKSGPVKAAADKPIKWWLKPKPDKQS